MTEKLTTLVLWKNFSPGEIQDMGQQLSEAVLERDDVKAAKKAAADVYNTQLDGIDGRINSLSKEIRAKGREASTPCVVRFHTPRTAFKQIVRTDTGELVREEQMSPSECQENMFEAREVEELNRLFEQENPPSEAA